MKLKYIILVLLIAIGTQIVRGEESDHSLSSSQIDTKTYQSKKINMVIGNSNSPVGSGTDFNIAMPLLSGTTYNPTPVDPANRPLNTTTYLVGTTKGAFNVNLAGGSSYTIPIDVLPGINGLAPSLSLVYSSNSGSGMAGYGWQVEGISSIGRSGQNYYNDGTSRGIELDYNDKLSLDGKRLVLTSGNYGYDQATYQTEVDILTRVQSQLASGSGPQKFLTQTRSGLKNLYGATPDSRQDIAGRSEILNWYISQTSDLYGNLISYTYLKDNGMVYPSEITYGPNKVTFAYSIRTDVTSSYIKGQKIQQTLLLDKVTVSYNSNIVKTYELKYNLITDNSNLYSELNEVIESGTGSSRLNSTVFSYQPANNLPTAQTIYNSIDTISVRANLYFGDFNGDGKEDVFCTPNGATWTGWKLYLSDGNNGFTRASYSTNSGVVGFFNSATAADLNGDGKDDIVIKSGVNVSGTIYYHYYFWISSGTSFTPDSYSVVTSEKVNTLEVDRRKEEKQIVDFDGDGLGDYMIYDSTGNWEVYGFLSNNGVLTTISKKFSGTLSGMNETHNLGDFNGDGKTDLWLFDATGLKIYTLDNGSFSLLPPAYTFINKNHKFQMGDFNGDGKSDLLVYGNPNLMSPWQMYLSTGTGFENHSILPLGTNITSDIVRQGDFNGDGRTDLMTSPSGGVSGYFRWFLISNNDGTGFSYIKSSEPESDYINPLENYYMADLDGDGRTDFLHTGSYTGYKIRQTGIGNTPPLLGKVANGLNSLTTIVYTKLSQAPIAVYQQGVAPAFPVFNFQGPMPVVSSVSMTNGIGGSNSLTYSYEGAKIHRQGKGFLGYSKIAVTDVAAGMLTETQSSFNTTYFSPLSGTVTKKTTGGTIIETTTNIWTQSVLDAIAKRIFPYVQTSTQNDVLKNQTITTTATSCDNFGNLSPIVKSYSNGVTETTAANYTNTVSATDWKLGRLDNSTITYAKSGETSVSQTIYYRYLENGILDFIDYYKDTPLYYYKNQDLDAKGNLTQLFVYGDNIGASQTNYTYDTNGIRVLTATDVLGHITTNTYDTYGMLQTEKDYLNNTNTYGYDAIGRQSSISSTLGSQTTTTYVWTGTNKPTLGVYGITQTGNDGSVSTVWYDRLGRSIRTEKKGFGGSMIWIDTEYNTKGQVNQVSDPYFANGSLVWAESYGYDNYGRTTNITRNGGMNTTYSFTYGSPRVSETTSGKTSWKETDSQGLVTAAHDNGGDITYAYYPDGKVKNIIAPGDVTTKMYYADAARNQTQLIDPNAGTINYTYDSFGRVKTQTDASSKVTTNTYLDDGRMGNVVNPEGTTRYSYNSNKQLTRISNSTTHVNRIYGYDTKGRVISVSDSIAGPIFSTNFTYDTYGRLSTRTHPSGIMETLGYNSFGYLATLSAGGSTRYTFTSMNAREQITGATYGSNLTATYGFDDYGYPQTAVTGSIQNYLYSFNSYDGTMNMRRNMIKGIDESYSYDNLYRLTGVSGPQNLTMTYSDNGNLITKSDIGTTTFGYGTNAGPYALTGITSSTGVIPSATQTATYTSFEKVSTLAEGVYSANFVYNSDNQRARMDVTQNGTNILTRWYAGSSYTKDIAAGVSKEITYIGGDAYTAPVAAVTLTSGTIYYYLLRDHLGSITHVVRSTDNTYSEYSYDAWGRRRNPTDWSYNLTGQPGLFADRGFTGHEYLNYFNLYNMNGRLYDPLVGRFLNVDPYVQMPDYSQNLNRYSYCLNNPLKFTDPDGEWIWIPMMIIGAYIGGISTNHGELNPTHWKNDFDTWAGVFLGGSIGATGGYGIMNPGSVELVVGLGNSYAYAGLTIGSATAATGMGTDWDFNFNWTTAAGGGGNYNLNGRNTSPEQISDKAITEARVNRNDQGEIIPYNPDFFDRWSESDNFIGKMSYDAIDGISVTAQSLVLGPNAQHLNGEQVSGYDRTDAFVNTVNWAIGGTAINKNINSNNWLRIGKGLDKGQEVFRVAWGAHPRYLKEMNNPYFRELNRWLRKQGGGHFDIWR